MSRAATGPIVAGRAAGAWIGRRRPPRRRRGGPRGPAQELLVARGTKGQPGPAGRPRGRRGRAGVPVRDGPRRARRAWRRTIRAWWPGRAPDGRRVAAPRAEREVATYPFADDAIVVVLDGITDPQNLGAAARSAEAAGAAMLITRTKRAADVTASAVRASAGALLHLPHARVANIARALDRLQDAGFWVVGLDGDAAASIYDEPAPEGKVGARRGQRRGRDVEVGA